MRSSATLRGSARLSPRRLAYLNVHTEAVRLLITSPYKLTPDTCQETLLLDMDHFNVLQTRFHSQAMAATLMTTVSTIIPSSDFAKIKERDSLC